MSEGGEKNIRTCTHKHACCHRLTWLWASEQNPHPLTDCLDSSTVIEWAVLLSMQQKTKDEAAVSLQNIPYT